MCINEVCTYWSSGRCWNKRQDNVSTWVTDCFLILFCLRRDNLDSMLKSRDITLLTKVHIIKAMFFPVVIYGCENWTIKKVEG